MRRFVTLIGSVAAAAALAGVPATAHAAEGYIVLNGQRTDNPSGCYNAPYWPLTVENQTDQPVTVHNAPNCQGVIVAVVPSGASATEEFGVSVSVP
ncbi:hypothetical protein ACFOVU_03440 [Nocardiopsis sediminis]|uniref:Secreted protein n=1 Tax=Nocardiopsis sediminis TaxID=1778267 RepID=A0ABV8FJV2_9ACTN